jgi:hypothetical protein
MKINCLASPMDLGISPLILLFDKFRVRRNCS